YPACLRRLRLLRFGLLWDAAVPAVVAVRIGKPSLVYCPCRAPDKPPVIEKRYRRPHFRRFRQPLANLVEHGRCGIDCIATWHGWISHHFHFATTILASVVGSGVDCEPAFTEWFAILRRLALRCCEV